MGRARRRTPDGLARPRRRHGDGPLPRPAAPRRAARVPRLPRLVLPPDPPRARSDTPVGLVHGDPPHGVARGARGGRTPRPRRARRRRPVRMPPELLADPARSALARRRRGTLPARAVPAQTPPRQDVAHPRAGLVDRSAVDALASAAGA